MEPHRPEKRVVQSDWQTKPLPRKHSTVALDRAFNAQEMSAIRSGLLPEEMEDKWFIYWSDDTLFFHRSWTGICIYVVRFECEEQRGARMFEAAVNRSPGQYGETSDETDAQMISYLIDILLLHQDAVFPSISPDPGERALQNWSVVGRAMMGDGSSGA